MAQKEETWEQFIERVKPKHPQVYDACMAMAQKHMGHGAIPWIHLADAVERRTISPMEAYDAIERGYLPAWLEVRDSRYAHLL